MRVVETHERSIERSLRLHAAVADRVRKNPEHVELARDRVQRWIAERTVHRSYADAWFDVLAQPRER